MEKFIGSVKFLSENRNLAIVHEVPMVQDLVIDKQFGVLVETSGGDIIQVIEKVSHTTTGGEVSLTFSLNTDVVPASVQLYLDADEPALPVLLGQDFPVASYGARLYFAEQGINFTFDGEKITTTGGDVYTLKQGIILGAGVSDDYSSGLSYVDYETGACEILLPANPEVDDKFDLNYISTYTTSGGETEFEFALAGFVKEGSVRIYDGDKPTSLGKDYPVGTKEGRDAIKAAGIDFSFDGVTLTTSTGNIEVSTYEGIIVGPEIGNVLLYNKLSKVNYYTGDIEVYTSRPIAGDDFLSAKYERNVINYTPDAYQLKLIRLNPEEFVYEFMNLEKFGYIVYTYSGEEENAVIPVARYSM